MKNITLFLGLAMTLNANTLPPVGYGTWPYKDEECARAVEKALSLGYTILDTATFYNNFEGIAEAIKDEEREKLTIVSKVWPDKQSASDLKRDLEMSLKRLNTPYIDIYLLHWPNSSIPIQETLQAMEELRQAGKIRQIGVSNFTVNHLKKILELNIPIAWNQIEMSPQFYDPELLDFCHAHGIGVQAYSPIGRGELRQDPLLANLGLKYGKTPAQIALRWIVQHGAVPLPGSKNPKHMAENLDVYDFELTQDEMEELNVRAKNGKRNRITPEMKLGYLDEFDFTYEECWPKKRAGNDDSIIKEDLTDAGNRYIAFLKHQGLSANPSYPQEIFSLCAKNCRKVRNGKLLFEGCEYFADQLNTAKEWIGTWSMDILDLIVSTDSRSVVIRYALSTEKEGVLIVFAILRYDENYMIYEINEVHNKFE